MATNEPRTVRLSEDDWHQLDKLAKQDQRSTSSLIRKVIYDYLLDRRG
jgi:predicted transcriptional regulator